MGIKELKELKKKLYTGISSSAASLFLNNLIIVKILANIHFIFIICNTILNILLVISILFMAFMIYGINNQLDEKDDKI